MRLKKLVCHLFGHKWVEGWVTVKDYVPYYSERHILAMYCTRCGKFARRCSNENYKTKRRRSKKNS